MVTITEKEQDHLDKLEARLDAGEGWKGTKLKPGESALPHLSAGIKQVVHGFPHIAPSVPEGMPDTKYDHRGHAIIRS